MVSRLLNADADNYLPIVYVSCCFDGKLAIEPAPLARALGGMAHVLVEPNRPFSRRLQFEVASRNVYGGRVAVYWPNGERYAYFLNENTPTEFDVRRLLVSRIQTALLNRRPLSRCTWERAEAEVARTVFEKLRDSGSKDVEEYVAAFDAEMRARDKQLEEAEKEINRLKTQFRALEISDNNNSYDRRFSAEQEFFDGEVGEIIKDALDESSSRVVENSRRQHVISSVANSITSMKILTEKRDKLKKTLRKYTSMTKNVRADLEKLGFSITEEGKHYKLIYMEDERYTFPLPKSGSDHRGGLNAASDISKRIY